MMMMMMMQRSLSVLLLLLSVSLSGAKGLSQAGDVQENSDLQQVSDAQEVRVRERRDAIDGCKRTQEQVAFGAALTPDGFQGPYGKQITLVYSVVYANVGNAYDPKTGIFTAPVKGVYYFSFTGYSHSGKPMSLRLYKNGKHVVMVYNGVADKRWETSTNGMNLVLEKGDQVYMTLSGASWIFDNVNHYCTFIGHLLFPLSN